MAWSLQWKLSLLTSFIFCWLLTKGRDTIVFVWLHMFCKLSNNSLCFVSIDFSRFLEHCINTPNIDVGISTPSQVQRYLVGLRNCVFHVQYIRVTERRYLYQNSQSKYNTSLWHTFFASKILIWQTFNCISLDCYQNFVLTRKGKSVWRYI